MCFEDGGTNSGEERRAEAWRIHNFFCSLTAEEREVPAAKYLKRPDERDKIQPMIACAFRKHLLRLSPPCFLASMNATVDAENKDLGLAVSEADKKQCPL